MTVTIVGCLADQLGFTSQWVTVESRAAGRNFDVERRFNAAPSTEYRSVQPPEIRLDINHRPELAVGHVAYLERAQRGGLFAVAELEATDVDDGPWYYSPEIAHHNYRDIELRALAIVHKPASVGLDPIEARPGTLADAASKVVYQHGFTGQLIRRAREYDRKRRRGEPLTIEETAKRRAAAAAATLDATSPRRPIIECRAAEVADVSPTSRTIEVLAVPYGQEATVRYGGRWITEIISNTAFIGADANRDRVKANREHDPRLLFGRVITLDPHRREGLQAEIRVSKTQLGNETLELCRDGLLAASVGFQIPHASGERWEGRDRRRVIDARLREVALVSDPAYQNAAVIGIRAQTDR